MARLRGPETRDTERAERAGTKLVGWGYMPEVKIKWGLNPRGLRPLQEK